MKKITALFCAIVLMITFSATLAEEKAPGRAGFSERIWQCTRYMGEGDGELYAFAFCPAFCFALFDYTDDTDADALADQQLLVYDVTAQDVLYDIESWDRLSLELVEVLTHIYGNDAKVPEALFSGFALDGDAPKKLFYMLSDQYDCTVLWYRAY